MAAEWPAEAGAGRPANPLQVAALVGSLVLIIVAMYIVFTSLAPLFSKGEDDPGGSQADPGASTQPRPVLMPPAPPAAPRETSPSLSPSPR